MVETISVVATWEVCFDEVAVGVDKDEVTLGAWVDAAVVLAGIGAALGGAKGDGRRDDAEGATEVGRLGDGDCKA